MHSTSQIIRQLPWIERFHYFSPDMYHYRKQLIRYLDQTPRYLIDIQQTAAWCYSIKICHPSNNSTTLNMKRRLDNTDDRKRQEQDKAKYKYEQTWTRHDKSVRTTPAIWTGNKNASLKSAFIIISPELAYIVVYTFL